MRLVAWRGKPTYDKLLAEYPTGCSMASDPLRGLPGWPEGKAKWVT